MSEFNFKSQICTDREQSERLLALGLKKETADMYYRFYDKNTYEINPTWETIWQDIAEYKNIIPAWSLGRLIELMPRTIMMHFQTGEVLDTPIERFIYAQDILTSDDSIAEAVSTIEWLIKEGYFNKEYLA